MRLRYILIGLVGFFLMTPGAAAADPCSHVTLDWIGRHVSLSPGAKIVLKRPSGEFCEVVVAIDGSLAPIYAGKQSLVTGRLFRDRVPVTRETLNSLSGVAQAEYRAAEEKKALAAEHRRRFFKENHGALAPLVSMRFGPGQAGEFVYVITDPNCSHCKALLTDLDALAFEAGLALKLVIYPALGQRSRDMAAHVLCRKFGYADYRAMDLPAELGSCGEADKKIAETVALMQSAKVSFVPLVVASDGSWVVEGNDICMVRTHLGLAPGSNARGEARECGEK